VTTIAIDGPGGAGKSTLAANLAARLGLDWLDTGAMYRAVTLEALRQGVDVADDERLASIARQMRLEVGPRVLLEGEDVTEAIRSAQVDALVSKVAAHPAVRNELVKRQRAWVATRGGGIVEGRDITSVVLPDADVKIYLTAAGHERAKRRADQHPGADAASVQAAILARDELDSSRLTSPLVVAKGAVVIDSSERRPEEVLEEALALVERARTSPGSAEPDKGAQALRSQVPRPPSANELRFYRACRMIAVGASRLYYPGPVLGAQRVPRQGPFLLAPVHRTNLDWLIVARVSTRRLRYVVKEEVWRRSAAVGRLLELLGAFPVARDATDREALGRALSVLAGGEPLVLFPEGTRRSGPVIGELRDGAAYLALRMGVPILPVGLGGIEAAMPRGRILPRPRRIAIVVGEPIDPSRFLEEVSSRRTTRVGRVSRSATKALSLHLRSALQEVQEEAEAQAAARKRSRLRHGV
jgi:cytidylate kinase